MTAKAFAKMDGCPVPGCTDPLIVKKGKKPTVVGVKRHVKHWHPKQYDKIAWPPIHVERAGRSVAKVIREQAGVPDNGKPDLSTVAIDQLRKDARAAGINPAGMRKAELIAALS